MSQSQKPHISPSKLQNVVGVTDGIGDGTAVVGTGVGANDGTLVGCGYGAPVGFGAGASVGVSVGAIVGGTLGVAVGITLGRTLGAELGAMLGDDDGASDGAADGSADGVNEGTAVGFGAGLRGKRRRRAAVSIARGVDAIVLRFPCRGGRFESPHGHARCGWYVGRRGRRRGRR